MKYTSILLLASHAQGDVIGFTTQCVKTSDTDCHEGKVQLHSVDDLEATAKHLSKLHNKGIDIDCDEDFSEEYVEYYFYFGDYIKFSSLMNRSEYNNIIRETEALDREQQESAE